MDTENSDSQLITWLLASFLGHTYDRSITVDGEEASLMVYDIWEQVGCRLGHREQGEAKLEKGLAGNYRVVCACCVPLQDGSCWLPGHCMAMGDAYVIVYSITDKSSFEKASELRVQLRRARQTDNVPIILVGNKSDLVRSREVSVDGKQALGQEREGDPGWALGQLVLAQRESLGIISG